MKELRDLTANINDCVRREAENRPVYKQTNGCIRITIRPSCEDADDWLGGQSTFAKRSHVGFGCVTTGEVPDIMTYEFTKDIFPEEGHGTFFEYPSSMSKSVSFSVLENIEGESREFLTISVCVSGARNVEDDAALAERATEVISQWFEEPFEVVPIM